MAEELHPTESSEDTSNGSTANAASGNDASLPAPAETTPPSEPGAPAPDTTVLAADVNAAAASPANSDDWQTLATAELLERRSQLQQEIAELSQRKQQLETDLRQSFAGQSDAIARRVKGFQEYLSGALNDLAQSVESLELVVQPMVVQPSPLDQQTADPAREASDASAPPANGAVGDCSSFLASGSSCQPTCASGYTVSGASSCLAGNLTAATCDGECGFGVACML